MCFLDSSDSRELCWLGLQNSHQSTITVVLPTWLKCAFDGFILICSALLKLICIPIFLTRSLHFALVSFSLTSGYAKHKNELLEYQSCSLCEILANRY